MDKNQALQFIYMAARKAPLTADDHDKVNQAAQVLQAELQPKEEKKKK